MAIPVSEHARHVTAIEANPETFRLLCTNIALNHRPNITAVEVAAGENEGTIEFLASHANTGGSKRKPINYEGLYYYDKPTSIKVAMRRLDDVVSQAVDAIVMDIEGSEYFALMGMPRILSESKILFVEFVPHHLQNVANVDVKKWLATLGGEFKYLHIPSSGDTVEGEGILSKLQAMFDSNQNEDVIIFSKSRFSLAVAAS